MESDEERFRQGIAIREQLGMPARPFPNTDLDFFRFTVANLFGTVFARPGLALRDREMVTLAVIIAIGGTAENLTGHFRSVRTLGFTDRQVKELILQVMHHAGWPRGANASQIYSRIKADNPALAQPEPETAPESGSGEADEFMTLASQALFGTALAGTALPHRDRQIVALAVVIAMGGAPEQLTERFETATQAGCDDAEIKEIIVQAMYYSGWPRGANANQTYMKWKAERSTG